MAHGLLNPLLAVDAAALSILYPPVPLVGSSGETPSQMARLRGLAQHEVSWADFPGWLTQDLLDQGSDQGQGEQGEACRSCGFPPGRRAFVSGNKTLLGMGTTTWLGGVFLPQGCSWEPEHTHPTPASSGGWRRREQERRARLLHMCHLMQTLPMPGAQHTVRVLPLLAVWLCTSCLTSLSCVCLVCGVEVFAASSGDSGRVPRWEMVE